LNPLPANVGRIVLSPGIVPQAFTPNAARIDGARERGGGF